MNKRSFLYGVSRQSLSRYASRWSAAIGRLGNTALQEPGRLAFSVETAAGGLGIYLSLDIVLNKTIILITNNCLFILEKEDL